MLLGTELSAERLAVTAIFLGAIGLGVGLLAVWIAGRSIADPVEAVRAALSEVERGNLDAEVRISQGSEVGLLGAGFNRMVEGLRERERIREAFGTYVDRDVAEHILREGTSLAGEEVEVTMLFLDIRGFTTFAERLSAPQVVTTLNRLFERIVPIIHAHGGHVDKYVGDGLLAVFGAPRRAGETTRIRPLERALRSPRPSRTSSRTNSRSVSGERISTAVRVSSPWSKTISSGSNARTPEAAFTRSKGWFSLVSAQA